MDEFNKNTEIFAAHILELLGGSKVFAMKGDAQREMAVRQLCHTGTLAGGQLIISLTFDARPSANEEKPDDHYRRP